jgi:subtilisin family serine protease
VTVLEERSLALVPGLAVRLRPRRGQDLQEAEARIRDIAPTAVVDRNSLYRQSYRSEAAAPFQGELTAPYSLLDWPRDGRCGAAGPIGIVDTRVDRDHSALAGAAVEEETMRGPGYRRSSVEHGTAVAALIIGRGAPEGAVPGTRLVAVDAFHRDGRRNAADVFDVVTALDRVAAHGVGVVNLSFTGPANAVLEHAGRVAAEQGIIIVAAAGNEGPDSGLRYPAAYDWAVAVAAVDQNRQLYDEATQGPHIAFAAPGVRLLAFDSKGRPMVRTGTSFASAYVAAALALVQQANPGLGRQDVVDRLAEHAQDLGSSGRDEAFGWGVPQVAPLCPPAR